MLPTYTLDGAPCDLEEFLTINTDPDVDSLDDDEIAAIHAMLPGDQLAFGGGACGITLLHRVS